VRNPFDKEKYLGEKPGLVVRAEGSHPRGRGFKSRRITYSIIKDNKEIKVAKWGTPKKYLKKKYLQNPFRQIKTIAEPHYFL
jgi:hypothetical protein